MTGLVIVHVIVCNNLIITRHAEINMKCLIHSDDKRSLCIDNVETEI